MTFFIENNVFKSEPIVIKLNKKVSEIVQKAFEWSLAHVIKFSPKFGQNNRNRKKGYKA